MAERQISEVNNIQDIDISDYERTLQSLGLKRKNEDTGSITKKSFNMEIYYVNIAIKVLIFISIINVWFFRFGKATSWRAGNASSMKEEFKAYGLSERVMYSIGGLKVLSAILLVISIGMPSLAIPAAACMAVLMLGAIIMHLKVNDPIKKSFPAFSFLILSVLIIYFHFG